MPQPVHLLWEGTVRRLPLAQRLDVAQVIGATQMSLQPYDYLQWLASGITTKEMISRSADAGVEITHLDPLIRWLPDWRPDVDDIPPYIWDFDEEDFFRFASALGCTSFSVWSGRKVGSFTTEQWADYYGGICERAATEGLRCDLEFTPICGIPDLETAWEIYQKVGAPNSGIVFDFWHYMRGRPDHELLSSIPGSAITMVQACDAKLAPEPGLSLVEDSLNTRCFPGQGEFPVERIFQILADIDALNTVGFEIFSSDLDKHSGAEIAQSYSDAVAAIPALANIRKG